MNVNSMTFIERGMQSIGILKEGGVMEKIRLTLTLDRDLVEWADKVAKKLNFSRSSYFNYLLWCRKREDEIRKDPDESRE